MQTNTMTSGITKRRFWKSEVVPTDISFATYQSFTPVASVLSKYHRSRRRVQRESNIKESIRRRACRHKQDRQDDYLRIYHLGSSRRKFAKGVSYAHPVASKAHK
jgi:hypothetical protein